MTREILCGGLVDIRCGDWRTVLDDVARCDALICDPPYSERVHDGAMSRDASGTVVGVDGYAAWTLRDVEEFAQSWLGRTLYDDGAGSPAMWAHDPRCTGWSVLHTDHETFAHIEATAALWGRYTFPPVPVLQQMPRVSGDGPGSSGHFLAVSRPKAKRFLSWGSLPCWYEAPREKATIVRGAKPLGLMRAIIRDYSRPGDLVVDPFCGGGTTALACAIEGRRCITSELDPATYAKAVERLKRGFTPDFFQATG